jgi:cyclic dehypoxanthinyl futalosine synthase
MIEENVVYAAGARNRMTQEEMRRLISDAGYTPVQRRTLYDACEEACCAAPIPKPTSRGAGLPVLSAGEANLDSGIASA